MPSPVLGVVLMIGTTFVSFGSLVVFATTNHYEKESCINEGKFQSIFDTADCDSEKPTSDDQSGDQSDPHASTSPYPGCDELLYEGSGIWHCPPNVTIQEIPEV